MKPDDKVKLLREALVGLLKAAKLTAPIDTRVLVARNAAWTALEKTK